MAPASFRQSWVAMQEDYLLFRNLQTDGLSIKEICFLKFHYFMLEVNITNA